MHIFRDGHLLLNNKIGIFFPGEDGLCCLIYLLGACSSWFRIESPWTFLYQVRHVSLFLFWSLFALIFVSIYTSFEITKRHNVTAKYVISGTYNLSSSTMFPEWKVKELFCRSTHWDWAPQLCVFLVVSYNNLLLFQRKVLLVRGEN